MIAEGFMHVLCDGVVGEGWERGWGGRRGEAGGDGIWGPSQNLTMT